MAFKILFQEQQKFTQWWLWLILVVSFLYSIFNFTKSHKITYTTNQVNDGFTNYINERHIQIDLDTMIPILVILVILLLFLVLKLSTKITSETLTVRYFPFFSKTWKWEDIESAIIIKYGFVGYGIRISLKYGTVYNVQGNKGLAITLKNGSKYLIGTQKYKELEHVVITIKNP